MDALFSGRDNSNSLLKCMDNFTLPSNVWWYSLHHVLTNNGYINIFSSVMIEKWHMPQIVFYVNSQLVYNTYNKEVLPKYDFRLL